jgi:hypothetical protein
LVFFLIFFSFGFSGISSLGSSISCSGSDKATKQKIIENKEKKKPKHNFFDQSYKLIFICF